MKRGFLTLGFALFLAVLQAAPARAIPTQYGDSGLLSGPTADTLNAGNICLGLWTNCSSGPGEQDATLVPAAITLGLGTFLEAYGSFPNLLFNDEGRESGRGFANLGLKARIVGKRSSVFKVSLDGQARRTVADDPRLDGLNDFVGRAIVSLKGKTVGVHANAGYSWNEAPTGLEAEDQVLYGLGVEFYPMARLRLIGEAEAATERYTGGEAPREVTAGFQYFISPHLTVNLGGGMGLSDASPDWRLLFGLSACQGIGTYQRPIPKIVAPETAEQEKKPKKPAKVVKIKTLTPLIPRNRPAAAKPEKKEPGSQYEIPVEKDEEVVLNPGEQLSAADIAADAAGAIAPVAAVAASGAALAVAEPAVAEPAVAEPAAAEPAAAEPAAAEPAAAEPAAPAQPNLHKKLDKPIVGVVYRRFRLLDFAFNQADITEKGKKALAELAEILRTDDHWAILRVEGHTDSVGSQSYNRELSLKRALTCARYLVTHNGLDPARCFIKGAGESEPLAANDTAEGRSRNRRVELLVLVPKE